MTLHRLTSAEQARTATRSLLLDNDERQQVFRVCLDALAHPGTIRSLGITRHPAAHLPMLALTDLMTPVAALGTEPVDAITTIAGLTRAPITEPTAARWVLTGPDPDPAALRTLPTGTAADPHLGAMVCIPVADLAGPEGLPLTLAGPGIPETRTLTVDGLTAPVVAARAELNSAYPRGVDLLLITPDGRLAGLPRTTVITVNSGIEGDAR
ncbi:phosphonate C-P lyase system protein PhnH [Ammonicoccus fulvus]|uniref:Phosphonate C-P lyase system protein PhnH n=1 Tax=Ammonicoccus fulvus TaxID=3138240 RepID=A0ABZ3FKY5_9ACTN